MKLSYNDSDVERWRQKAHWRLPRLIPRSGPQVLKFINDVGFCFAFKTESTDLPSLWFVHGLDGAHGHDGSGVKHDRAKDVLLTPENAFYGRVLRRRPTLISAEFLTYFYALQGHHGKRDDYVHEYTLARLSTDGRIIMNQLVKTSSKTIRELKEGWPGSPLADMRRLERAIIELEMKLFITRVHSHGSRQSSWSSVYECFPAAIRKARHITAESARTEILKRYVRNQLVVTVSDIQRVLGWKKPAIYQTLGALVNTGHVSPHAKVNGMNTNYYCLVH